MLLISVTTNAQFNLQISIQLPISCHGQHDAEIAASVYPQVQTTTTYQLNGGLITNTSEFFPQ